MPRPAITFPNVLAAVAAGEHAPQTLALCEATGLTWAELLYAVDPARTAARYDGRAWSDTEREWLLRLIAAGCSQSLIARMLQRPRSGVSYALQLAKGSKRVYPSTGKPVGRPRMGVPKGPPPRRNHKADELMREQYEWAEKLEAFHIAKKVLHAARGRV